MSTTENPVIAQEGSARLFPITDRIIAEVGEWQGRKYVDIREWWPVTEQGKTRWARTKKGLRLDVADFEALTMLYPQLLEWVKKNIS